jgi:hypothetical protein
VRHRLTTIALGKCSFRPSTIFDSADARPGCARALSRCDEWRNPRPSRLEKNRKTAAPEHHLRLEGISGSSMLNPRASVNVYAVSDRSNGLTAVSPEACAASRKDCSPVPVPTKRAEAARAKPPLAISWNRILATSLCRRQELLQRTLLTTRL